jgi:hypothetical protein
MSGQTAELLEAFESLAPDEKRVFTAGFLRRAIPFDSGPLDDEETAHAADNLFALLDAEENDPAPRPSTDYNRSTHDEPAWFGV